MVVESARIAGGNLLGNWHHHFSESASSSLQLYYDRTSRDAFALREDRDTFDLDVQHQFGLSARQSITWGLGYRLTSDDTRDSFGIRIEPLSRNFQLFSGFVQDQIAITDELRLTLGTKLEHNDFTGIEVQPSGRLLWMPHADHVLWAAISLRTPSGCRAAAGPPARDWPGEAGGVQLRRSEESADFMPTANRRQCAAHI